MKKIKFWAIINDQVSGTESIKEELRIFQKDKRINVELREFSWSKIWPNIINSIKEEDKPDVVQIGNSWISTLKEIDFLEDLTALFSRKNYGRSLYNISPKIDKKYYAAPWFLDLNLMFLRNTAETKNAEIKTVDDLFKFCRKNKKEPVIAMGGMQENILIQYISSFIWAEGGKYIHKKRINLLDSSIFKGIYNFFDLIDKYGTKKNLHSIYGDVMWNFFFENKGLLTFSNAWVINSFIKPHQKENDFCALVMPGNGKKYNPFIGGSCLGIVKGKRNMAESKSLIKFLTGRESQMRYLSKCGLLPARKDVMKKMIDEFVYKDVILKTLENGKIYPAVPYWGSFEKIFTEFINFVFLDILAGKFKKQKLKEEIVQVNKKLNAVIQLWER
ncbi:MAG: extracellular solute-binding protein [Spirochaetes bacterium]|nr:extracellular solute-binding protein [Spirochaetota bacterium]